MVAVIAPMVGKTGVLLLGSISIPFKNWSLSGSGGSVNVTSTAGKGYGMVAAGMARYSCTFTLDVDTSGTMLNSIQPGAEATSVTFEKTAGNAFCTFANAAAASSTNGGMVSGMDISCDVEGAIVASIEMALNGAPAFA